MHLLTHSTTQYATLNTPSESYTIKPFTDHKISTKTVMAYPNCGFIVSEHLANMFPINEIIPTTAKRAKDIENPKPGIYQVKSLWGCRGISNPKGKRAFRNQITILIYHNNSFCNIKIFPTGKLHMTGCKDKKSYTLAAIKLLNMIRSFHTEENPTIVQVEEDIQDNIYKPLEPLVVSAITPLVTSSESTDNDNDNDNNTNTKEVTTAIAPLKKKKLSVTNSITSTKKRVVSKLLKEPVKPQLMQHFGMIFDVVMVNLDFILGFKVDLIKLNDLLLETEQEGLYPVYEATNNTSVNIKMTYDDPVSKRYDKYYLNSDFNTDTPILQSVFSTDCKKVKPKKVRTHTFLVFSSGKVIQSGTFYDTEMKSAYHRFCKFIYENRSKIEVGLSNEVFDFSQLRGLNALYAASASSHSSSVTKKEKLSILSALA